MKHLARRLPRATSTWPATVLAIVISAGMLLTTASASAATRAGGASSAASEQHASALAVSLTDGSVVPAASAACTEFVNATITEYSDKSIGFSSSNQCVGIAPAQTIDVTLLGPEENELDHADNSCGTCQVLGASGVWPGPAVAGKKYTMEISTVLVLPPSEEWTSVPPHCVLVTEQTLSCMASTSITAK